RDGPQRRTGGVHRYPERAVVGRLPEGCPRGDRSLRCPSEPEHHGRGDPPDRRRPHPRGEAHYPPLQAFRVRRSAADVQRAHRRRAESDRRTVSVDVRGSIGALIRTRRAVRAFKSGIVPDADVNEILEAARWAPSPANRQPARFIWVKSSSIKRELQELAKESKDLSAYWDPIFRPDGTSGRVNDLETPEVIAVLADPAKSLTNVHADNGFEWAAAMSIYAIRLAAQALGSGGHLWRPCRTERAQ